MAIDHQQANDKFFLSQIKMKPKYYIWKENQNMYDMSSGRSIKPADMTGFHDLCEITTKNFAKIFIDLPDVVEMDGKLVIGLENKDDKDALKLSVIEWIDSLKQHTLDLQM
jgi:hypothetical protein